MNKPVCLILGAGAGIGGNVAKRFARDGYHACLARRSDRAGPERFEALRQNKGLENDGLLVPAEVADTYYHLAHQHRSAWTFELDLRTHSDLAWWNHAGNPDLK